ncbi:dihydroneopterin aldolase [Sphingobium fuliginis]|jgi:dihydroneopterin aldolase|uniref:Dihydroneopterin aldolase n=1 Tax=Sphingobium fuliginis (strain ATCC 27551) TaxID=336203 RepID=A0A7M2GPU7_SPHSA|nr:dihydroneopterin aldolase [Sphingobium fuliginis]QOT73959.1 dihydroneopterin aldolase [Sphingobium fuliginis]
MVEVISVLSTVVRVRNLSILADVGINIDEIGRRQPLVLDIEATLRDVAPSKLDETIDYRRIVAAAQGLCDEHIPLIEDFAIRLGHICLGWPQVRSLVIAIDKPFAVDRALAGVRIAMARDRATAHQGETI